MPFPEDVKTEALDRAHYSCVVCRTPSVSLQVHHIIPQGEDGPDTIDNACPLCPNHHADLGGNKEKRKMLRQMRDFWWDSCEERGTTFEPIELNRKIAELQITQERSFETLKNLVIHSPYPE